MFIKDNESFNYPLFSKKCITILVKQDIKSAYRKIQHSIVSFLYFLTTVGLGFKWNLKLFHRAVYGE